MTPYFLQPYNIFAYLQKEKQVWPNGIVREVYLSWEDALWDLLPRLGYRKNSLILVPSFYCTDVVENMISHGYRVKFYPVSKDLVADKKEFISLLSELQPDIVINFCAEGITYTLPSEVLNSLHLRTLLITDMVHRIPQPGNEFYPVNDRHLIINSYRKVTPFTGALAIYSRNARPKAKNTYPYSYFIRAFWLWHCYLLKLWLAKLFRSTRIARYAEITLKKHNDLIGDSFEAASLWQLFLHLYDRIASSKIDVIKEKQGEIYEKALSEMLVNRKDIWIPVKKNLVPDDKSSSYVYDFSTLRGFPIIMQQNKSAEFLGKLRKNGFLAVTQLDDCEWSKKHKLILLPLGPELKIKQQEKLIQIVASALTSTK